jgi:hypothetical protein
VRISFFHAIRLVTSFACHAVISIGGTLSEFFRQHPAAPAERPNMNPDIPVKVH